MPSGLNIQVKKSLTLLEMLPTRIIVKQTVTLRVPQMLQKMQFSFSSKNNTHGLMPAALKSIFILPVLIYR